MRAEKLCEKLGIEYNHLNQYLGKKSQKNIGDKFAAKVTEAHKLPIGWLDHPHDKLAIKNIVQSQEATNTVVQLRKLKITLALIKVIRLKWFH
jgi:hypothetical protein